MGCICPQLTQLLLKETKRTLAFCVLSISVSLHPNSRWEVFSFTTCCSGDGLCPAHLMAWCSLLQVQPFCPTVISQIYDVKKNVPTKSWLVSLEHTNYLKFPTCSDHQWQNLNWKKTNNFKHEIIILLWAVFWGKVWGNHCLMSTRMPDA